MESSAALDIQFSERRQTSRITGDYDVDVVRLSGQKAGDQIPGKINNISRGGAEMVTTSDVEVGDQLSLIIYSEDDSSMCDGRIIWKKKIGDRVVCGLKILHWTFLDSSLEHNLPNAHPSQ